MSNFWSGVLIGTATSGLIAWIVYLVQKRDSSRAEKNIANKIASGAAISREGLRTTLDVRDKLDEIHEAVVAGQLAAAGARGETLMPAHLEAAEEFLEDVNFPALSALHVMIAGPDVVYAGLVRDANVSVAGCTDPALRPVGSHEIEVRLDAWLKSLASAIGAQGTDERDAWKVVSVLHAELMRIHPFFDGNGLLGRAILSAMCKRLLGVSCVVSREDPEYFSSLRAALSGDADALVDYLRCRGDAQI